MISLSHVIPDTLASGNEGLSADKLGIQNRVTVFQKHTDYFLEVGQ
jgi:hypothetical protein